MEVKRGVVLDERTVFTLSEMCRCCGVSAEVVIEMVAVGLVEPRGAEPAAWRFEGPSVARVQRALRLYEDLGVNLPGAALALDLLDEIDRLRARLQRWPEEDEG